MAGVGGEIPTPFRVPRYSALSGLFSACLTFPTSLA
jgi:hypothetical protein